MTTIFFNSTFQFERCFGNVCLPFACVPTAWYKRNRFTENILYKLWLLCQPSRTGTNIQEYASGPINWLKPETTRNYQRTTYSSNAQVQLTPCVTPLTQLTTPTQNSFIYYLNSAFKWVTKLLILFGWLVTLAVRVVSDAFANFVCSTEIPPTFLRVEILTWLIQMSHIRWATKLLHILFEWLVHMSHTIPSYTICETSFICKVDFICGMDSSPHQTPFCWSLLLLSFHCPPVRHT